MEHLKGKSRGKATLQQLGELHGLLVQIMQAECEMCLSEGIPMSASTMGVMVQFLKNNAITAEPDADDMAALREGFNQLTELKSQRAKQLLAQAEADPLLQ